MDGCLPENLHVARSIKDAGKDIAAGGVMMGLGMTGVNMLKPAVDAFADLEEAQIGLKTCMIDSAGNVPAEFEKLGDLAERLGNKLPGTTMDMYALFDTMVKNGGDA